MIQLRYTKSQSGNSFDDFGQLFNI